MMRRFLVGLLLTLLPLVAHAACPTLTVTAKDASGATQTFCVGGSAGNFVSQVQVLDSTSANYLAVNGSGQIAISNTAFGLNAGSATVGKVDVLGNAGAIMDFAGQNAAAPANALLHGCEFNTTPTTITNGNASPCQLDSAGNLLVNLNTAIPAGTNAIGTVKANLAPTTSGGLLVYHVIAAASDNHANIKNGAGQVYGIDGVAAGTGIQYVRLYNAGTGFNGCNSATNLIWGQQVPAAATASGVGAGYAIPIDNGAAFSTGISICITGAVSDTDTTNAATTTVVNVHYK